MENKTIIKLAQNCYWNFEYQTLTLHSKEVKLTLSQKKMVHFMVENINRPVESIDIFCEVWDLKEFNEKSVRNIISSIRKLLPCLSIINVYGGHYMLRQVIDEPDPEFKEYIFEILDQSNNAIVITDPNKKDNPIIYINSAFTDLFGFTLEDVIGKNCRFMHKEDREQLAIEEIRLAIKALKPITVNLRNYGKNNQLIYNEVTISPIFDKKNGKLKYFLGVHKDVTMIHRLIQQIQEEL